MEKRQKDIQDVSKGSPNPDPFRRQETIAQLQLRQTQGIGASLLGRMLEAFGSARCALQASPQAWLALDGIGPALVERIQAGRACREGTRQWEACERQGVRVLLRTDAAFPQSLLRLPDAPTFLFVQGKLPASWQSERWIAIVGTRQPDARGRELTRRIVAELGQRGFGVVSGGALGIDAAAHEAALRFQRPTVAVLGSGLDRLYPSQHKTLFHELQKEGALFSEYGLGVGPERGHFPQRNRLIAGLCCGVVVVQCRHQSGALNTASHAKRLGIPVFAFPGRPGEVLAAGPHRLIREGAHLVESGEEIASWLEASWSSSGTQLSLWESAGTEPMSEKREPVSQTRSVELDAEQKCDWSEAQTNGLRHKVVEEDLTEEEQNLLRSLSETPQHVDELVQKLGIPVSDVLSRLLLLELQGWVQMHPGMQWCRLR